MSKTPTSNRAWQALVDTLQKQRDSLRERLNEADKEDRRLSEANCRFQLENRRLCMERTMLAQALFDSQTLRGALQDRIGSLELSLSAKSAA